MITVQGKFFKKIFFNQENGYLIAVFSLKKVDESLENYITVVGNVNNYDDFSEFELDVEKIHNKKFGHQFLIKKITLLVPSSKIGLIKFLSSDKFPSIGKIKAQNIIDIYGLENTLDKIIKNPDQLTKVKGIDQDKSQSIAMTISDHFEENKLYLKFLEIGIPMSLFQKIIQAIPISEIQLKMHQNPYILLDLIETIRIKTIDKIAKAFNHDLKSFERQKAYIVYGIKQLIFRSGNTYVFNKELFFELQNEEITFLKEDFKHLLKKLIKKRILHGIKDWVTLGSIWEIEKSIAQFVITKIKFQNEIPAIGITNDFLDQNQILTIEGALKNGISVITGPPGTGKTTIIKELIAFYKKHKKQFDVITPTGRAAKNIELKTSFRAKTIHKFLKCSFDGRFEFNSSNPSDVEYLIIDEFSMVDIFLFYHLIKATPFLKTIILIGDGDQLPSIKPGFLINDLINFDDVPKFYLNKNYRQKTGSSILQNAWRMIQGKPLIFDNQDCVFKVSNVDNFETQIQEYFKELLVGNNILDVQILAPVYASWNGINNINILIQKMINFQNQSFLIRNIPYYIGDKVIQLENWYENNVYNGDIGIILDYSGGKITIDFQNNKIEYSEQEFANMVMLAYAISIHKSQGSEFKHVLITCFENNFYLNTRKLFYTGITRAKEKLIILGTKVSLNNILKNNRDLNRKTNLKRMINNFI